MKKPERTLYDVTADTPTGPVKVSVYAIDTDKARTRAEKFLGMMAATYEIATITPRPAPRR